MLVIIRPTEPIQNTLLALHSCASLMRNRTSVLLQQNRFSEDSSRCLLLEVPVVCLVTAIVFPVFNGFSQFSFSYTDSTHSCIMPSMTNNFCYLFEPART